MRRIKLVVAALVVMVAAFAAFSGPVMAADRDDRNSCNRDRDDCYNNYYNNYPYNYYNNYPYNYYNYYPYDYYPYNYYNYYDPYSYYYGGLNSPCFPFCGSNYYWGY